MLQTVILGDHCVQERFGDCADRPHELSVGLGTRSSGISKRIRSIPNERRLFMAGLMLNFQLSGQRWQFDKTLTCRIGDDCLTN